MIWADRVPLVFAGFCAIVVVLNVDPPRAANTSAILVVFLWLVCRALDFLGTGRIRSSGRNPPPY